MLYWNRTDRGNDTIWIGNQPKIMLMYMYLRNFLLGKNFTEPSYFYIAEMFTKKIFRQCSEGHHILYIHVIFNIGEKSSMIKFRQ